MKTEEMMRKLDTLVGSASSKAQRESLLVSASILPEQTSEALSLLMATTIDSVITKADLEEMKAVVAYEIGELENKPEDFVPELVHGPAFYGDVAAHCSSILSIPETLETLTVDDVNEFRCKVLDPHNLSLVGAGIPHEQLQTMSIKALSELPFTLKKAECTKSDMKYIGGHQYTEIDDLPLTHIGIGFAGLPAWHNESYALAVLQMLLGGGGSFSAGGPGKGMYSRLYTHVLNRHHWIESAKVFNFAYSNTGLFGIHGSSLPSHARELAVVMINQLFELSDRLVGPEDLDRAKNQVKSAILMGLESRNTQLEDMADQLVHRVDQGVEFESPQDICRHIDAVQAEDLRRVTRLVLSSSKPTVIAHGPLHKMPSYDTICKWIHP